ncbi:MAG: type VI secretion system-associated protein TagO [Paracoccaceae bacterium]
MTDDTTVTMKVKSEQILSCGYTPAKALLVIRCMENRTSFFISTECHLASGHGGYGSVTYRLDDHDAITKEFDASSNNAALGLWFGSEAIPVVKNMFDNDSAIFRFMPYNKSTVTARFNITGLRKQITPLREACGW